VNVGIDGWYIRGVYEDEMGWDICEIETAFGVRHSKQKISDKYMMDYDGFGIRR
jgi:hypothetical protein